VVCSVIGWRIAVLFGSKSSTSALDVLTGYSFRKGLSVVSQGVTTSMPAVWWDEFVNCLSVVPTFEVSGLQRLRRGVKKDTERLAVESGTDENRSIWSGVPTPAGSGAVDGSTESS
jgi:hypothetical protein